MSEPKRETTAELSVFARCPCCGSASVNFTSEPFTKYSAREDELECLNPNCGHTGPVLEFLPES